MKIELHKFDSLSAPDITCMGYSCDMEVGIYEGEAKKEYIICYVTTGRILYNGNPVCEGQGFLSYPGMGEEWKVENDDKASLLWVCSQDERMKDILATFQADPDTMIFEYTYISIVKNAFKRLEVMHKLEAGYFDVYSVFISIMQAHFNVFRKGQTWNSSEVYLQFSLQYVQNGISENIRIEELAERIGISQAYLYHIFKEHLGISPKEYISSCRAEEAKKLLLESGLSVTEIGKAVGYSDPMAFSRFFTSRQGMSPTKFRKKYQDLKENNRK